MNIYLKYGIGSRECWITDSQKEFNEWALKHCNIASSPFSDQVQGRCIGGFVWVRSFADTPSLVHEVIHAVDNWMQDIGISNDSEVRAYVVQGIVEKVIRKTKETGK